MIDYWVECDCDAWVLDLKDRRRDIWQPQGSVTEEVKSKKELPREEPEDGNSKLENKKTLRPQATRDDKMSGAYQTFKILDLLWNLQDASGQLASRPKYWQKTTRASISTVAEVASGRRVGKGRPAHGENSNAAKANRRRKSHPSCVQGDNHTLEKAAYIKKHWEQLRVTAPGLPEKVPESIMRSGRVALAEIKANLPSYLQPFKFNFTPTVYSKGTSSHIPNLKGLSLPMSLISHPPSGATLPLHTPRCIPEKQAVHRAVRHSYGTRKNHRYPSGSTLIADSEFSAEDTIVVAAPLTPKVRRIKRMGSLGTILSSSPEIYHDAEEGPDESGSGTSQEYHDAIEWGATAGL